METNLKIEVSYNIRTGNIYSEFNTILITPKPDMTISNVFDLVRRKYKNDKDIIEIRLLDIEKLKSEL